MYNNILFAVDLGHEMSPIAEKVRELTNVFNAQLNLIHVVQLPVINNLYDEELYNQNKYIARAKKGLTELGEKLKVAPENQFLEIGDPREIILEYMKNNEIDLLIIGHQKRHGIYHILGSTAQTVLSHSNCDVLTILL